MDFLFDFADASILPVLSGNFEKILSRLKALQPPFILTYLFVINKSRPLLRMLHDLSDYSITQVLRSFLCDVIVEADSIKKILNSMKD